VTGKALLLSFLPERSNKIMRRSRDIVKERNIVQSVLSFVLAVLLVSCAPAAQVYKPITLERPPQETLRQEDEQSRAEKIKASKVEEIKVPGTRQPTPEKLLPPRQPIDPKGFVTTDTPVMINAEKMPLPAFIIYALGETLKIPFVMDEKAMNMKQTVSLRMPTSMPPAKAFDMVLGLLEKQGLYLEARAGTLYILQKAPDPQSPMDVRVGRDIVDSSADILQVVPLRHIRTIDIEPIFKDMYKSSNVQIKPYSRENVLLLYGKAFQIRQMIDLIETFDVPSLSNKKIMLLRLTYWQVDDFIRQMSRILEGTGYSIAASAKESGPLFVPIKQMNGILVVSPDEQTAKYILDWKEKLDNPEASGAEEKPFIYTPRYSKASELVASIENLYGTSTRQSQTSSIAATDNTTQRPQTGQTTATTTRTSAVRGGSLQSSRSYELKISADDRKNIIMIVAPATVYRSLLELLQGLDVPARQVLIEVMIAELTLTDELQYGVEWYIKDTQQGGQYTLGTLGSLGLKALGLSYSFISQTGNFQALISALATRNKVNILSRPRLTILDNREATIQVGQDVPTVTSEIASATAVTTTPTSPTNVVRSIQYRSTGVMLKVKPTINTEGLLTLDISQEVSEIGSPGVSDSPIILARKLNTSVVVAHGQTIALGGLMKDNDTLVETKVPLLGDIPLLGNLFKYTAKTKEKTELLILVTPTILTGSDDADKVTRALRGELLWFK
jgi:general secretion pathway protein D